MSISFQAGWLMYVNPDLQGPGKAAVLHGAVALFELSSSSSSGMYGTPAGTEARFCLAGVKLLTGGTVDQMAGEALQEYPGEGGRLPPQFAAMRELARRHPGEYQRLCEEAGLPALVVARDAWTGGLPSG